MSDDDRVRCGVGQPDHVILLTVKLTPEEHAKLCKLAERVSFTVNPKAPTMTPEELVKHYIKTANVDDDWQHPSAVAAKAKR